MSENHQIYIDGMKRIFRPGSVDKVDYVRTMNSDLMSLAAPGYMRVDGYADDRYRLTVLALDENMDRRFVYSTCVP